MSAEDRCVGRSTEFRFASQEDAATFAATCRRNAPVSMWPVQHGDHWHVVGTA